MWRAVTVPAELERWFPAAADWKLEAGEVFEAGGQSGEITELDPPRLIAWTFAGNQYRIELQADPEGCLLIFTYVFDDRPAAAQWAAGWDTYLNRLEPHLGDDYLSEEAAHQGFLQRNDHYADRFGLDPEVGRRFFRNLPIPTVYCKPDLTGRPHELTVERTMPYTPERLYRAWTQEFDVWFAAPGTVLMKPQVDAPFFFQTEFQGTKHPHYGRFLRLEPSRRVELTWVTGQGGTAGAETVVTVTFTSTGDARTLVRLTQAGFYDQDARDKALEAWPLVLEQQEELVAHRVT